ncbi:MAG: antitoxin [Acidobacteriota bacterium]
MKTTIEISDELLIDAKKRAAELRKPLRAIMEEALRRELERITQRRSGEAKIEWVTVDGGLPPGLDVSDRESMAEWLKRERSG